VFHIYSTAEVLLNYAYSRVKVAGLIVITMFNYDHCYYLTLE